MVLILVTQSAIELHFWVYHVSTTKNVIKLLINSNSYIICIIK